MASSSSISTPRAIIVGAGLIGLSVAHALTNRGWRVLMLEKGEVGAGASWAAAGMLAPYAERLVESHAHPELIALGRESLDLWPEWASALEQESGLTTGLRQTGTLIVSYDPRRQNAFAQYETDLAALGGSPQLLTGENARTLEPGLSQETALALSLPRDIQADSRATTTALAVCLQTRGVEIVENAKVRDVQSGPSPTVLVHTSNGAASYAANVVFICAGWQAATIPGLPDATGLTPIKGQALALENTSHIRHTIRTDDAYLIPKENRRLVVGATVEPGQADQITNDTAIETLRQAAIRAVPALAGARVIEQWAGVRPGTPDYAPLLGEIAPGVFIASGHHRNGVLLAPITGALMADMATSGTASELASHFSPTRFHDQPRTEAKV